MTGLAKLLLVGLFAALFSVSASGGKSAAGRPENTEILRGKAAESVFAQCSRIAPPYAAADFEPTAEMIRDLEAKLPEGFRAAVGQMDYKLDGRMVDLDAYYREYAAYMADGRRMIYGNFAPLRTRSYVVDGETITPEGPMMICDGGPVFFGVEYDVERREIIAMHFNGRT